MNDTILYDLREFLFRHTESRVHLLKRIREIVQVDPQILHIVRYTRYRADIRHSLLNYKLVAARQTSHANLRARKVLGELRELFEVHVSVHHPVRAHLCRVDVQDLVPSVLVWQRNFHVHFLTPRAV